LILFLLKSGGGNYFPPCTPGSDDPGTGQKKGDELCVQFRHIFKDMLSLDARCQQGWGALIRHPGGAIQYCIDCQVERVCNMIKLGENVNKNQKKYLKGP
jgi:hypothetical protein